MGVLERTNYIPCKRRENVSSFVTFTNTLTINYDSTDKGNSQGTSGQDGVDSQDNGVFLPAKEVLAEELDFDETERKFYDDLLVRGQRVVEELKNSKGGLGRSYMCLLTMLLRLRQGTTLQNNAD